MRGKHHPRALWRNTLRNPPENLRISTLYAVGVSSSYRLENGRAAPGNVESEQENRIESSLCGKGIAPVLVGGLIKLIPGDDVFKSGAQRRNSHLFSPLPLPLGGKSNTRPSNPE